MPFTVLRNSNKRGATARTLIDAAVALVEAQEKVAEALRIVNGHARTPYMRALINEENRISDLAFRLEHDYLLLAEDDVPASVGGLPPLLGSVENVKAAKAWLDQYGVR
jgi:hypothetical protein